MSIAKHHGSIAIAAGGTGGHVFPALALGHKMLDRGYRLTMLTEQRGERYMQSLMDNAGVCKIGLNVRRPLKLSGQSLGKTTRVLLFIPSLVRFAFDLLAATLQVMARFIGDRPAVVVAFGGYPVIPALLAAILMRIPIVIHEQNAWLGRTNRWLAWCASTIAVSFDETIGIPKAVAPWVVVTGNPLRPAFQRAFIPYDQVASRKSPMLLVLGGSQGAHVFSHAIPKAVYRLPIELRRRLHVVQQCRQEDLAETRNAYAALGVSCDLQPFFDNIPQLLEQATVVIARAGASTIAEIAQVGRPTLFVPYPHAMENHQYFNVLSINKQNAAWLVCEGASFHEQLASQLAFVISHRSECIKAAQALKKLAKPDAVSRLADVVERWVH